MQMPTPCADAPDDLRIWRGFERRHRRNPFLGKDTLYALPGEFIDCLTEDLPGVLSTDDERFERDLLNSASGGFFHQLPFPCPFAPSPLPTVEEIVSRFREICRE